jgi:hypothetical protein
VRKIGRREVLGGGLLAVGVAGGIAYTRSEKTSISILGDSTAIGDRIPMSAKPFNLLPALDPTRWWNQIGRTVSNHGVGGWRLDQTLALIESGLPLAERIVIFDRINIALVDSKLVVDEKPDAYLATLDRIVRRLGGRRILILPQIVDTPPSVEVGPMAEVNVALRRRWPLLTLSAAEEAGLQRALADPATRSDAVHRSPAGQAIEARFIRAWMDRHGW